MSDYRDANEFNPDVDLMRFVTVTVVQTLGGQQRRMRLPLTTYYTELEPVLQRLEKLERKP